MRKEIFIPVILILLGLLFIFINGMVFFSKGNRWFISSKLKVGAMILSLTGILACGSPDRLTCYKTAMPEKERDSIRKSDSIAKEDKKKADSIYMAEKEKQIDDSIAIVNKKKQKKDSIAKIKHRKINPVRPVCYGAPANTCYTSVPPKKDTNSLKK